MPEALTIKCPNSECRVATTGKCVEGYELSVCPHLLKGETEQSEIEPDTVPEASTGRKREPDPDSISLAPGVNLPVDKASDLLKKGDSRVVAIIGPYDSGKTSLIGALYNLFLKGPVGGYQFSGSQTLLSFEQASHAIRAASGRHEPEMEHTGHNPSPSGITFYHLSVQDERNTNIHLLLGDRTGEDYKNAGNDPSVTDEFVEIKSADNLTFLVNGNELLKPASRENAKAAVISILQGLVDGNVIRPSQRLLIVLTKLDEIETASQDQQTKTIQTFDSLVGNIQRIFGDIFVEISSLKIAASPKNVKRPFGYEVDSILRFWTRKTWKQPENLNIAKNSSARAIGRFRHE